MSEAVKKAVKRYRRRAKRKGLVRVEVQVPREDATTVRTIARVLRSDDHDTVRRLRQELRHVARSAAGHGHLKALLEGAPLEGIEIQRSRDVGRTVELD